MKGIPVKELPKTRRSTPNKLQEFIKIFYESKNNFLEVTYAEGEYSNNKSCINTLSSACKRSHYPVKVVQRNYKIYLVKI